MAVNDRISQLMGALDSASGPDTSRATSPGGDWRQGNGGVNGDEKVRQRTFPYFRYLPYPTEDQSEREENLDTCLKHLYIAVSAGDFAPGAVHWTREIRGWLSLKFNLPRSTRVKLVYLYYELALAPGLDAVVAERFASMFMVLTKRKHYLRFEKDLILDWRPLFRELKLFVLPSESGGSQPPNVKRNIRTLTKMCTFAQVYFDPKEIPAMFEEIMPFFSTSFSEGAFVVCGLLNLLLPTHPAPEDIPRLLPQEYLPTIFHLWSLVNRSRLFDTQNIDSLSRLARENLTVAHVPFSQYGLFTREQCSQVFTAMLRLLEIPVGQATSPYSSSVDLGAGLAVMLERDPRKHPVVHHIARLICMSLSPACAEHSDSILTKLEGLIQAIETFFHPSNSGSWTRPLAQFIYYLADFFVLRWNREQSGEMEVPEDRRLNNAVKRRFVLCLREVTFMGIFSKSDKAMQYALSALQSLAYLEPSLILPGALQKIYPAMQGLVEVHRTISSIRALHMLSNVMAKTKGFRCHVTTLLGLALPGIDANDLEKTVHTLQYVQGVCYLVPFHDLTKAKKAADEKLSRSGTSTPMEDAGGDTGLAVQWITEQVSRLESASGNIEINYDEELSDEDEAMILRSSTTGLNDFIISFLGRVFTLLENLPDASRVRSGSPEEYVVNHLPAAFTPLLAALSPELYDVALDKIANFIANHVIHQAKDAIAFICNSLVKINPQKALKRLLPPIFAGIRTEIEDIGAGSTRTTGAEVLPRDRALVWNLNILSMCVVHVGDAVLEWKDELFELAEYMQQRCRGTPTVHVSNFIHHLLLNLTCTFTVDYSTYEQDELEKGLTTASWGRQVDVEKVNIKWHTPSPEEIDFAIKVFETHTKNAMNALTALTSSDSPIKREGTGKDWSDDVSRNLTLLRLIISGISVLFDVRHDQISGCSTTDDSDADSDAMDTEGIDDDAGLGEAEDEEVKPTFQYESGYPLKRGDDQYKLIHELRQKIGEVLHTVHQFLIRNQPDDVPCFNALYNAYRSWFIDVGIERSAHVLDRIAKLLSNDERPFKFSGLRKQYPRPLLVRRANVYHLQRLRHNANPRPKTDLDVLLLLDIAESSISLYTEIRRTAQTAIDSAVKCVLGARPLVVPTLLDALIKAIEENDYPRIKGAMFSLLFGGLHKTISRDWRFAPKLIKCFIEVTAADKPSIQKLATNATFQILDMGKAMERMVILDKDVVEEIADVVGADEDAAVQQKVTKRRDYIKQKRARIEGKKAELSQELVNIAATAHWKKVQRTAAIIFNLGMRYDTIASEEMIDLVVKGAVDQHPSLRGFFSGTLVGLFSVVTTRAITGHSYEKYLLGEEELPDKIEVPTKREDPNWTEEYLASFAQPEAKYYVDSDHPGWLVWNKTMTAFLPNAGQLQFDNVEIGVRKTIAKHLTRSWFSNLFAFMKQEPRDTTADRFRMSTAMLLTHSFDLVFSGMTEATFEDIKDLTQSVYGDGSDKHQHRATAEIMAALLSCAPDLKAELRQQIWEYAFPIVRGIFKDGLTPENSGYWTTFLHVVLQSRDPRRGWPLVDWLASFRLDMDSNAAFKESSKIHLLMQCISDAGWHFQLEKPILEDFMQHLDHPYKGVREAMGQTIATIHRTRYHESYKDIGTLIKAQKNASSIGVRPYEPTPEFAQMITDVFARLEAWRHQRPAGQQTPSSYTSGGKTVLLWLDSTLSSYECTSLIKFFPDVFMEQLLHMMDIKEDPELQSLAYHVFRHLPNIPHREGEDVDFIAGLIRIGRNATSWHQRLRILINIQVLYFRRLFLMSEEQQQKMFDCVSAMLSDVQLEVRIGAATTLSGMIRCSPTALRDKQVSSLKDRFTAQLSKNPLPKRRNPGTPTPEQGKLVLTRHAAVLGLGALIQAFPYQSPPPAWLPDVLATLARKAAADPGVVGKSVKTVLADFKKTRQDTWHVDVKAFEQEQLEDLEGVLWKSYFA